MVPFSSLLSSTRWRSLLKRTSSVAIALMLTAALVWAPMGDALAARSGGRIGGGSFRAPSRSYSAPSRSYSSPSRGGTVYGGGGFGGGIGFPFILPFFGFGGGFGGLLSILVMIAIANVVINALRGMGSGGGEGGMVVNEDPPVTIAQIQVGLLATARELQKDLDKLAVSADTATSNGRALVLQEATLSLMRHPEYWVYGSCQQDTVRLSVAEATFNQLALTERSKFSDETLSNFNNQLRQSDRRAVGGSGELAPVPDSAGEFILVTVIVATLNKLSLPEVNDASDLKRALQLLGGMGGDSLLAIEVLWTPQQEGDTLTANDIMGEYPDLRLM